MALLSKSLNSAGGNTCSLFLCDDAVLEDQIMKIQIQNCKPIYWFLT